MTQLIDKEYVLEAVKALPAELDAETVQRCIEVLSNQSTVDAVPVRHGKWQVTPVYIKCSECGESFMLIPQNYCPNCGADMRGEKDG